jgi:hypothetical protein
VKKRNAPKSCFFAKEGNTGARTPPHTGVYKILTKSPSGGLFCVRSKKNQIISSEFCQDDTQQTECDQPIL